jgi:TonB family protein
MSASGPKISERIERVLSRTPPSMPPPRLAGVLVAALLIPVTVFVAATTRAAPPADPNALPPLAERVMGMIRSAANPDDYYPATAKHERVTGYAVVEVDVDALGQLVDARVLEVEPTDPRFGFADAALQVARNTKYGAPYQQPSTFKFKVKFALTDQ